jgi:hypothetical protein
MFFLSTAGPALLRPLGLAMECIRLHVTGHEDVNFSAMIFVVGEAFVNLGARQRGEAVGNDRLDRLTCLQKGNHIMHADASALDDGLAAANARDIGDVAIAGGWKFG